MKVKWKTKVNKIPEIQARIKAINGAAVQVGALEGEHAWLAGIHEYGCDIKATRAKYLTIPCSPKSYGKRATDFGDLFTVEAKSGEKFLCQEVGKDGLEALFWLTPSVHIPERSFLRSGYDNCKDGVIRKASLLVQDVIDGKISEEVLFKEIGMALSDKIRTYARNLQSPSLAGVTEEARGSSNPLDDTGEMIKGITWRKA